MINDQLVIDLLSSKLGAYQRSGNQVKFFCPNHSHHKKKLEVNIEKGLFKCWICSFHGHISYLCKTIGLDNSNIQLIKDIYPFNSTIDITRDQLKTNQIFDDKCERYFLENSLPFFNNRTNSFNENQKDGSYSYLINRRELTDYHIIKYSIQYGFTEYNKNSVFFPSFDINGKIDGYIVRFFSKNGLPIQRKYFISKNNTFVIWNSLMLDLTYPIYITEGVFDYIKLDRNGICLLGSIVSENVFNILLQHKYEKYFCLDKDAGIKSIEIIKTLLRKGVNQIFILRWDDSNKKDLGEFSTTNEAQLYVDNNIIEVTLDNVNTLEMEYRLK